MVNSARARPLAADTPLVRQKTTRFPRETPPASISFSVPASAMSPVFLDDLSTDVDPLVGEQLAHR